MRKPARAWLAHVSYASGQMEWARADAPPGAPSAARAPPPTAEFYESLLKEAKAIADVAYSEFKRNTGAKLLGGASILSPAANEMRWFILPAEAAAAMRGTPPAATSPFDARSISARSRHESAERTPDVTGARDAKAEGAGGGEDGGEGGATCACVAREDREDAPRARNDAPASADVAPVAVGSGWVDPPKALLNKVYRAVLQHGMLKPGDRVLLGLSGGKDSLTLLHALRALQKRTPFKWDLGACTVDPRADGFDPAPLKEYLKRLGCPYFYEEAPRCRRDDGPSEPRCEPALRPRLSAPHPAQAPLLDIADTCVLAGGEKKFSICSFCSRMKRGVLYTAARREGYNVLAMAQALI